MSDDTANKTVLIVESEPWLGDHYERVLTKNGFTVSRASNGYAAIDMIDEKLPEAIVMSLLLSGTSGLGLLHELQTYVDTAKIPVIVCGGQLDLKLEDLEPYGVKRLLDSASMRPDDVVAAVRSVTIGMA
ncbi:MAG: response regulator [Candidatus Nomurabacteria bacterium]|nr:MAG: response regulator [Candidatus Nomurabacteria bacterium]